jgi:thiamine transporter
VRSKSLLRLVESAVLIAVGTVLSIMSFPGFWPLGGSITLCAMLPIVVLAHRHGTAWGLLCGLIYALLQMVLGFQNVQYATSTMMALDIVMLDYILPFTLIGLSAVFNKAVAKRPLSIALGILMTFSLRFLCHFASGIIIWGALFPNELGWAAPLWSLSYNGSYMLPETLITLAVALLTYRPLKRFWLAEDLNRT